MVVTNKGSPSLTEMSLLIQLLFDLVGLFLNFDLFVTLDRDSPKVVGAMSAVCKIKHEVFNLPSPIFSTTESAQ